MVLSVVVPDKNGKERCVDMATELFELKTRFNEQEKELKWAKREAESRERDFKVRSYLKNVVSCREKIIFS